MFSASVRVSFLLRIHAFAYDNHISGVNVEAGVVRMGTPICVPAKEFVFIGVIASIEINNKPLETAQKGQEVNLLSFFLFGQRPRRGRCPIE